MGTFGEIKAIGTVANLEGKTIITSAVHDDQLAFYKQCKVNLVIDVSPNLFGRVVGVATLEAMILAHLGRNANELADDEFEEIITELNITPRLLHPTGKFRNIRRFAFVVHPLSQEFIKKGFPIPKATPKMVMDKVEQLAAYIPPQVYCKMENIVSPTGAEAEGWLLFVGGTPKEMLSHSPEFTYRRLLAAAAMAEKMGAQLMGLGAFTKVVGDAGVTVARRATHPHHHRQQLFGLGRAVGRGRRDEAHGPGAAAGQGHSASPPRPWSSARRARSARSARGCWRWPSTRW